MKKGYERMYQFHVTLNEIDPPIWRRIQVPETYSFWDLHVAIQEAMGWLDYHLHEFRVPHQIADELVAIGIPDDEMLEPDHEVLPGWEIPIADYFSIANAEADYQYDFGDDWQHPLLLEAILDREPDYDPEEFDPTAVRFENPKRRWKRAFEE